MLATIASQIRSRLEYDVEYHTNAISRTKQRLKDPKTFKLAIQLDALLSLDNDGLQDIDASCSSIQLTFTKDEQSRKFVSRLMEKFAIKEFPKSFLTYSSSVRWFYIATINDINVKVYPAEPSPDCTPVQIVESHTNKKWVCAQTGKEL